MIFNCIILFCMFQDLPVVTMNNSEDVAPNIAIFNNNNNEKLPPQGIWKL